MKIKDLLGCKFGVAINEDVIKNHKNLIVNEFNSVTFENALKFNYRIKENLDYDFKEADKLYEFAVKNNLSVRGHCLVWHVGFPQKILGNLSRDELLNEIRRYTRSVAKRYPSIYAWDVVNEIYSMAEKGLRKTPFSEIIGEDYIEECFKIAREELGNKVELYYNEEDEWFMPKIKGIIKTAKRLVKKKVPIDGIGLQCHISCYEDVSNYRYLLENIKKLGLKCQITEMEVSVYDWTDGNYKVCPQEVLDKQAKVYLEMFKLFEDYKDTINLINFWSVSDGCTWRDNWPVINRKDWPTLFDEEDNPKKAYNQIVNYLAQKEQV